MNWLEQVKVVHSNYLLYILLFLLFSLIFSVIIQVTAQSPSPLNSSWTVLLYLAVVANKPFLAHSSHSLCLSLQHPHVQQGTQIFILIRRTATLLQKFSLARKLSLKLATIKIWDRQYIFFCPRNHEARKRETRLLQTFNKRLQATS